MQHTTMRRLQSTRQVVSVLSHLAFLVAFVAVVLVVLLALHGNHAPTTHAPTMAEIHEAFKEKGVGFIAPFTEEKEAH